MTKGQAAAGFFAVTGLFTAVFVALTIHSHTRFDALTHADRMTEDVLAGKDVWHAKNCVNCHTLMGEGAYYAPDLTEITQHRGSAYLTAFMKDPALFYSEEEDGRLMNDPQLSDAEIAQVIAFLDWIAGIDNFDWPPRPILVSGSAASGAYGTPTGRPAASDDPVAVGEALFRSSPPGCFTCHSTAPGVTLAGPTLAGLGQRAAAITAGAGYTGGATTAEGYIRESIVDPNAHLVAGAEHFAADGRSMMPDNYGRTLDAGQVSALVAYLMTLR